MEIGTAALLIVAALACGGVAALMAYRFFQQPTEEQVASVKSWLLWAVTEAEKNLGHGTGRLKLRQVYDLFVQRFPYAARLIPFDTFAGWVDEALEEMKRILDTNRAIQEYVYPENAPTEQ